MFEFVAQYSPAKFAGILPKFEALYKSI